MCGRTTSTTSRDTLARLLDVDDVEAPELPISWNVAPTQPVYAVATSSNGSRKLRALRWGLVPSWAKDPRIGARLINARAETLTSRPAFRSLVKTRRALLPVSGFYEWRRPRPGIASTSATTGNVFPVAEQNLGSPTTSLFDGNGSNVPGGSARQPFYFCRADGEPLVFAGLWDLWVDAEGQPLRSCTIITTTANELLAPVHHRMPVIMPPAAWDEWLRPAPLGAHRLAELLAPAPDNLLTAHPVGASVNSVRNDDPALIAPAALTPEPLVSNLRLFSSSSLPI